MNKTNPWQIDDPTKPFRHTARYGTELVATQMALHKGTNVLKRPRRLTNEEFATDVFEITWWWIKNIQENFPPGYGFNTPRFTVEVVGD